MTRFLLDTVVLSESRRDSSGGPVRRWLAVHGADDLLMSVLSVGEIQRGIARLPESDGRNLRLWFEALLHEFAGRILPVDTAVAHHWGQMVGELERRGLPPPRIDSLIAATAAVHGLTVVTRNVADFAQCGVETLNPWAAA